VGDDIYVSGRTGEARLALEWLLGTPWARAAVGPELPADLRARLERPTPRLALGQALASVAHAALDLSDGLTGDLGHILAASGVGADVQVNALPVTPTLADLPEDQRMTCLLAGGDDYELLFTAPVSARGAVRAAALDSDTAVTRIGTVSAALGLRFLNAELQAVAFDPRSFDHFAS
jgi:thiamine-monophosphate kinase